MIRHIVMWNFQEKFSREENLRNAQRIKKDLEHLKEIIPGIISLTVEANALAASNRDIMLNGLYESEEALAAYQTHPEHQRVSAYVGTMLCNRSCFDYCETD